MSKEELDHLFKNKLQDHTRMPSANAWEKLENRLDGENKPVVFRWWYIAAAVALLIMSGVVFWNVAPGPQMANKTATLADTELEDSSQTVIPQEQIAENNERESGIPEEKSMPEDSGAAAEKATPLNLPDQHVAAITPKKPLEEIAAISTEREDAIGSLNTKEEVQITEILENSQAIASADNSEKVEETTLRFSIEEFDEALIPDTNTTNTANSSETKKKGLKKLWASVKSGQLIDTNMGELREAKDDLLSFNKGETQKP